jgi:fructosamine-3-kinase
MTSPQTLPATVEELTAGWFADVLGREVTEATVVDSSSGTTGRARVALEGDADVPATVFVKLRPFNEQQRQLVDRTGMGVAEARFYRDVADEIPVRVPQVWFAGTDGDGYVMVLEDLAARGCRFPGPDRADIEARAYDIVEQLAVLHATYWESERFGPGHDLEWLVARGTRGGAGGGVLDFVRNAVDTIGDQFDDTFHQIASLYLERAPDISRLWREGPSTLIHGDCHIGNLYIDVDDRTGFLDWAVICRGPAVRDVAYVMCNSVPVDVRERIERDVVERYCARLAEGSAHLEVAAAWDQYRLFAVYSWLAAATTAGMGSKWQPISTGIAATRRATAACAHLDSVGLLHSLIG